MEQERLMEVWGVHGSGAITVEIPRSTECFGLPEFFEYLFSERDHLFGTNYERIQRANNGAKVRFSLDELAQAAFAKYEPSRFAKAIHTKLDTSLGQGEDLCRAIRNYEENNMCAYLAPELGGTQGRFSYYFAPLSDGEECKQRLSTLPRHFKSTTKHKRLRIEPPRLIIPAEEREEGCKADLIQSVIGHHPINFIGGDPEELLKELTQREITPYYFPLRASRPVDLNFDPFFLARQFEDMDTSGYEILRKE